MHQRIKSFGVGCLLLAAAAGAPLLRAQTSIAQAMASRGAWQHSVAELDATTPPTSLEDALRTAFLGADVVFAGEVTGIVHADGAVVIRWRVEDAVRGAQTGGIYDLREWPGLWDAGGTRYTVGQRALVMLYAPSVAGYASPVSGGDGIVYLRGDAPNGVLDLRLLAQHTVVTDAARLRPLAALHRAGGSLPLSDALQAQALPLPQRAATPLPLQRAPEGDNPAAVEGGQNDPAATTGAPVAAEDNSRVDASVVLGMLHAWQRESQRKSQSAKGSR